MTRNKAASFFICLIFVFPTAGQNITRPNIAGPGGVRVNSYTGNMFLQRNDLYLAGRMPVDISFSYNSADRNRNSGYGRGWTFNYGMQVKENADTVTITRNDGRKDAYIKSRNNLNQFIAPAGIFDSLVKTGIGAYYLRTKEGYKYFFANAIHKRLTRQEDRNGNALTFSYADSLITTITDDAGRTVQLTYSNGRLTGISEANGSPTRTLSYEYDNAGNLLKVTDPMGFKIEYGYIPNGPMNIVKDKNGNAVDVVYNENFAVKEIISCLTRQTINYSLSTSTTHVTELVGSTNQLTSYKFDADGNLIQKTGNCCGFNVKYEYDKDKNVSKITDANGNDYTYTYDGMGNMLSETDPLGHTSLYTYDPVHYKIRTMKDKNGNSTSYTYDAKGNLVQMVKPLNITENYSYAFNGDFTAYIDGKGNRTTCEYDSYGNLTAIKKPQGSNSIYNYDAKSRMLAETNPLNHVTKYAYDAIDRLISITDPLNHSTSFTYDNNGNLLTFTDPNDHTTSYSYDALDRNIKVTNALGKSKYMSYDAKNKVLVIIDENGNSSTKTYDNLSHLTSETNASGETTYFTYDGNGNIISIIYPSGNTINLLHNSINRVVKSSDKIGDITSYTYDNKGNKISETDGNGNTTAYFYDALDRITSVTDAKGNSNKYTYDENSNMSAYKNRNNQITNYVYNSNNKLVAITNPLSHTTSFSYDLADNLTSVKDANNNNTIYTYDALNRNITEIFADGTSKTYVYDFAGNIITKIDGNGAKIDYTYNNSNALISRNYPDNNHDNYIYDNGGRLIGAANSNANLTFTYDPANRLKSETLNGRTTSYLYNTTNNTRVIQYPSGRIIEEIYDVRNRLKEVREGISFIAKFAYDNGNRNTNINYQNGTNTDITFDANNHVSTLLTNPGGIPNFSYTYDNENNRVSENKLHNINDAELYSYDNENRLTIQIKGKLVGNTIPFPVTQIKYNYDAVGNRINFDKDGNTTNYYTNSVNIYTAIASPISTISPRSDNNGNVIFDGRHSYLYDYENRVVSVDNGTLAFYKYDAIGRRIEKSTNISTVKYFYDGNMVIEEEDSLKTVLATYIYGSFIDHMLNMVRENHSYFYNYNTLGSVSSISNVSGNIVESYEYDVYGNIKIFDSLKNVLPNSGIKNTFTFSGRQIDFETGNYYFINRGYDPVLGRFNQRDPIEFYGDDFNLFSYVINNPVNFTDPVGLTRYNTPDTRRTTPPTGQNLIALQCFERCSGQEVLVTGGQETRGHRGRAHGENRACDFAGPQFNPHLSDDLVLDCATRCGYTNGWFEEFPDNPNRNHWHMQIGPGGNVPPLQGTGQMPHMNPHRPTIPNSPTQQFNGTGPGPSPHPAPTPTNTPSPSPTPSNPPLPSFPPFILG